MKKRVVILILTLVFLAGAMAAAGLPLESRAAAATSKPTETPAVTPGSLPEISPAPEEAEPEENIPSATTLAKLALLSERRTRLSSPRETEASPPPSLRAAKALCAISLRCFSKSCS